MSTSQPAPRPTAARALAKARSFALFGALLLTVLPVRAETDSAAAQRIALEHMPGTIESIERSYGMFRVGVRAADGLKYELSIDIARGTVQRVRPAR